MNSYIIAFPEKNILSLYLKKKFTESRFLQFKRLFVNFMITQFWYLFVLSASLYYSDKIIIFLLLDTYVNLICTVNSTFTCVLIK